MARPKFNTPTTPQLAPTSEEIPAGRPPVVPPCEFLREKSSGMIYPYSEDMAARGDLVEAYEGDMPDVETMVREARLRAGLITPPAPPKARRAAKEPAAPPAPPAPPQPELADGHIQ